MWPCKDFAMFNCIVLFHYYSFAWFICEFRLRVLMESVCQENFQTYLGAISIKSTSLDDLYPRNMVLFIIYGTVLHLSCKYQWRKGLKLIFFFKRASVSLSLMHLWLLLTKFLGYCDTLAFCGWLKQTCLIGGFHIRGMIIIENSPIPCREGGSFRRIYRQHSSVTCLHLLFQYDK